MSERKEKRKVTVVEFGVLALLHSEARRLDLDSKIDPSDREITITDDKGRILKVELVD